MTVVVDPYLLSIPSGPNVSETHILEFVNRLLPWDAAFRTNPDYVVSYAALQVLRSLGLTPELHNLERVFAQYGITDISARDVAEGCQTVMENYPMMEGRPVEISVTCLKDGKRIIPDEIYTRLHYQVADAFSNALVEKSYVLDILGESEWSIATAPIEPVFNSITVYGRVLDSDTTIDVERLWPLLVQNEIFSNQVDIQHKVVDVYENDPMSALKISWNKVVGTNKPNLAMRNFNISFMPQFVASLKDRRFRQRPNYEKDVERVFEAIAYSLTNIWAYSGDKHHMLRTTIRSRTAPQQTRNRQEKIDLAGRIEAVAGSPPLHVHYWHCHDGSYEISNVTTDHDDATIYK